MRAQSAVDTIFRFWWFILLSGTILAALPLIASYASPNNATLSTTTIETATPFPPTSESTSTSSTPTSSYSSSVATSVPTSTTPASTSTPTTSASTTVASTTYPSTASTSITTSVQTTSLAVDCRVDPAGKITGSSPCLCGGSTCGSGYCCNGRTCGSSSCGASSMNLDVILLTDISFYVVGDACTSGNCCSVYQPSYQTPILSFENNGNYKTLKPSDPSANGYGQKLLIDAKLNASEIQRIKSEVSGYVSKVSSDSGGSINLNVNYIELPHEEITLNQWGCQFWVDPNNVKPLLSGQITKNTDFTMAVSSIYDSAQNACISTLPICGGMRGADWDFFGVSYDYVPDTATCVWYNCAETKTFYHEWLHELDFALNRITGVQDIYNDSFPQSLCQNANPDPKKWFPSPDTAASDPDFPACISHYGDWSGYCSSVAPSDCDYIWDAHLLSSHYNSSVSLIGNHCRNGVQDLGETGVDCGGSCSAC